jgi:uroporphyrinogen decarboxylase
MGLERGNKPDTLSPRERIAAVIAGEKPDRVPVLAFVGGYAARLAGMSLKEFYTDPVKCLKCQLLAADLHRYDDGPGLGWADWGGWEFGATIEFPQAYTDCAPRTANNPVTRPEQVEGLAEPDPATAGMYPLLRRFNRLCRDHGLPAKVPGGSVTSVVAGIVGRERLLRWYIKEPEAVQALYEKAASFILKAAARIVDEFGAENCGAGFSAPLDSNELISPRVFDRFVWPQLRRVNEGLMALGLTRFTMHICGNHRGNLARWADLPLPPRSIISVGSDMDVRTVAAAFGHKHIIAGNVPTALLHLGTYEEVFEAARGCLEKGKDLPGGYILMPACEAPVFTPPLNIHALVKSAWEFGRYS